MAQVVQASKLSGSETKAPGTEQYAVRREAHFAEACNLMQTGACEGRSQLQQQHRTVRQCCDKGAADCDSHRHPNKYKLH